MHVLSEIGTFTYNLDGKEVTYQGEQVFVCAKAIVTYGEEFDQFQWYFNDIYIIDAETIDGNVLKLTTEEENSLVDAIRAQLEDVDMDITDAAQDHWMRDFG